jgi:[ribosomal protein S5]-alanine N-acetyltransferase
MSYFLTSQRLGFRCWTADDESLAIGLWCDPQVTALIGGPWSPEVARARLAEEIAQLQQFGVQYWPVFLLESGEHMGCAGFRPHEGEAGIYELGIHLLPAFWSRGFAMEAAQTLIQYGFDRLEAEAIFAGHHPENAASRRLLDKLGFAYQGDVHYIPTGLMHPTYLLAGQKKTEVRLLDQKRTGHGETKGRWAQDRLES